MNLVLAHGWSARQHIFRNQILTDNHDNHAGRPDVFLNAPIKNAVSCHVNRLRKKTGGYVSHQSFTLGIRQRFIFGAVNRIIFTNINIVCIIVNRQIRTIGNIAEGFILTGCHCHCLSVLLGFLKRLLRPLTGNNIVSDPIFHQVLRNHGEL